MLTCQFCRYGDLFNPRPDELEKFGDGVMGCKRPNWEGYTQKTANCDAFFPAIATQDYRNKVVHD